MLIDKFPTAPHVLYLNKGSDTSWSRSLSVAINCSSRVVFSN
jgi:hypothetical protein